ncbi:MAG: hypothetical protein OHK0013_03740 [Sandaracinaceae bacterium]
MAVSEPASSDLVIVEPDGSVRVPGRVADRKLRERAGRYRLVTDAAGLLILRGEGEHGDAGKRVLMAGEIISRTTVLEILNVIAAASWRGQMYVFGPDATRVLAIDQGALKHARSGHPDDRLGQVLYRNGLLSKAQLDQLVREVDPERRLGQLVLEKGFLQQDVLFQQLQKQVEQIFFASLLAREGTYAFVSDDGSDPPAHAVHLPVAGLLMEGVQRIDEMALFRERIPHDDLVPEVQPRTSATEIEENAQLVLAYADGERTIDTISRETGLGTFHTVKALYGLLQQGLVILRAKRSVDAASVRRLVGEFNMVLRDIFMAVATYGGVDQTRSTLEAWIAGSGYGPIFGERVEEDGALDTDAVVSAMLAVNVENPMEGLLQALHELSAFALFAATTTLPRDQELALSRYVAQRLKRIRL